MISRRQALIAGALGAVPLAILAQAPRPIVGMLVPRPLRTSEYASGLLRRLAELGYRDGDSMALHYRSAGGVAERFPALARELTDLKCDLIFAVGSLGPALALRKVPTPVVFLAVDYDPVAKAIVTSLRRPGGTVTGVYVQQEALIVKRFELMREVVPNARRFLVLADPFSAEQVPTAHDAAKQARVDLTIVDLQKKPYDYAAAFEAGRRAGAQGLVGLASPVFSDDASLIAGHLRKHRMPAVGSSVELARNGYLLAFGPDAAKVGRRAAEMAVRILKGSNPAEIPVELADEFAVAVNAGTARAIGVKIPESVLARATIVVP
jgi:putative tryptophan/tyrosine transport system substrate-binding protein